MASRYKWYRCEISKSVVDFYEILGKNGFFLKGESGFVLAEDEYGYRTVRYYWTVNIAAVGFSIDGSERLQSYTTVLFQEFSILEIKHRKFLRLKNPGRNLGTLFNAIEELAGTGFWIEPVILIGHISDKFRTAVDASKLTGLKVTNIGISSKVVARFEFASKEGIEHDVLEKYLNLPHVIDFCGYEVFYENLRCQVSFYGNGQVKTSDKIAPFLIDLVEKNIK